MSYSNESDWQRAKKAALKAFAKAVTHFGPSAILDVLLKFSDHDPVLNQLLCRFPSLIATAEFLGRIPPHRFEKKSPKNRRGNRKRR